MAVTAVNGTGTQTDITIARKYHKKGTNTYYLYDAQGNRYKVGQGIYNKATIGGTINSSQLPFNKKVTFQTPVAPEIKPASQEVRSALESEMKANTKGLSKAGKWGLAIAGLAVVGTTLFGLSKCSDDKKQQLPPVEPEKKPEPKPEPEKPVAPVQPEKSEQNQEQKPENGLISVVKGSSEWKYAELELIAEHLGQAGYRPSNQEITDRMNEIVIRENKTLEDAKADDKEGKNRHSIPILNEGDMLKVSPELKKLIDEATNELKEAHKDNPNYKVTWTELRAKVQEKLNA